MSVLDAPMPAIPAPMMITSCTSSNLMVYVRIAKNRIAKTILMKILLIFYNQTVINKISQ